MAVFSVLSQKTLRPPSGFPRELWDIVVASAGQGSIRSVCTASIMKYARSLIMALAVSAVCSPVTDPSVSFPGFVLILYVAKDILWWLSIFRLQVPTDGHPHNL